MRRLAVFTLLAFALVGAALIAAGCGGSSSAGRSGTHSRGAGTSGLPAASTPTSDGQLGGAVVARPGKLVERGHVRKITGKLRRPRPTRNALGAEDNCPDQDVQPTASNLPHVGDVVFCLMNAMRADAGVPALKLQDQLTQASVQHSQDMVQNRYFAHDTQDGGDVVARLTDIGYIPATGDWVIGENLAWGSGTLATPKALVNAWMNSPEHRDNLLSGDFQDVGMGLAYGTPSEDAPDGLTATTDFGTRTQSGSGTATTSASGSAVGTASGTATGAVAASKTRAARHRRARAVRRRRALRRCRHRHGHAHTRCVRRARRMR